MTSTARRLALRSSDGCPQPRPHARTWNLSIALALCALWAGSAPALEQDRLRDASAGGGAISSGGTYYVEWWPEPAPVPLNEMFVIHFRVLRAEERTTPVPAAVITASAWMPEHNHGTSLQAQVESKGNGSAVGSGFLLHMEGHWQLRIGVAAEGKMERVSFDFELRP